MGKLNTGDIAYGKHKKQKKTQAAKIKCITEPEFTHLPNIPFLGTFRTQFYSLHHIFLVLHQEPLDQLYNYRSVMLVLSVYCISTQRSAGSQYYI